jgi:beta-barrel assembly-enhancing protease
MSLLSSFIASAQPVTRPRLAISSLTAALLLALGVASPLTLMAPTNARAADLPELGDASEAVLSEAKEREIGSSIMRQIRSDPAYVDDPDIHEYLRTLGQRLIAASGDFRDRGRDIEFFMIQDDSVNAFALVGGYIGIYSGLMLLTQSESELAGVVGHEIAHILQRHQARGLQQQGKATLASLAALAVAVLASRGSSSSSANATDAAIASAQALQMQGFLDYSREFEREADRMGLAMLDKAGFDVRGMAGFFERLMRQSRFNDPGDKRFPGYLRTHPLSSERVSDMQSRVEALRSGRAGPSLSADSTEYAFVKAKLRAGQGTPREAVDYFRGVIAEKGVFRSRADGYGYTLALTRAREFKLAREEIARLRQQGETHPMLYLAEADMLVAADDRAGAIKVLQGARERYSDRRALQHRLAQTLIEAKRPQEALQLTQERLALLQEDAKLWELQARAADALGQKILAHRSQGEAYYRRGWLPQAVDQFELGLRLPDPEGREHAVAAARVREIRREIEAQKKQARP